MQITIVQSEIELAIQNYIRNIIALQPGTSIAIELKATRGPEGTTAVIDITSGQTNTVGQVAQVQAAQEPEAKSTPKVSKQVVEKDAASEPKVQQNPSIHADEGQFNTAGDAEKPAEASAEAAPASDDAAEVPAEKPRSLFGNLGKPKNA